MCFWRCLVLCRVQVGTCQSKPVSTICDNILAASLYSCVQNTCTLFLPAPPCTKISSQRLDTRFKNNQASRHQTKPLRSVGGVAPTHWLALLTPTYARCVRRVGTWSVSVNRLHLVRLYQFSDHGGPQRGEMLRWHAQQQHSEEEEDLGVEDGHLRQTQTLHQALWAHNDKKRVRLFTVDRRQQVYESTVKVTLDVWQVLLVLVNFAAVDGEGQAFEQHGSLLQLSVSVREQTQRAALCNSNSRCRETQAVIFWNLIRTRPVQTHKTLRV